MKHSKVIKSTRNSKNQLHSLHDEPALAWENGEKEWLKNSQIHREIGPAIIWADGKQAWAWEGRKIE